MQTLRDITIDVIKGLPDSCSLEEIMYQINLAANAIEGLSDEQKGNAVSTGELLKRLDK